MTQPDGELIRDGDAYVLRFERELPHPIDRVWQALTEPAGLAAWFPSAVEMELRVGGTIVYLNDPGFEVDPELLATSGEVVELDPKRRLAFTWGNDLLRFELAPRGAGCRMVFTHRLPHRALVNRTVSGWSVCLDSLAAAVAGTPTDSPGWRHYYDHYVTLFGDEGWIDHDARQTVLRFERLMPAPMDRVKPLLAETTPQGLPGEVKWQLIPIGGTCLVLLTHTVASDWDAEAARRMWEGVLAGLNDSVAQGHSLAQ